jgi:hypothetical protein
VHANSPTNSGYVHANSPTNSGYAYANSPTNSPTHSFLTDRLLALLDDLNFHEPIQVPVRVGGDCEQLRP